MSEQANVELKVKVVTLNFIKMYTKLVASFVDGDKMAMPMTFLM